MGVLVFKGFLWDGVQDGEPETLGQQRGSIKQGECDWRRRLFFCFFFALRDELIAGIWVAIASKRCDVSAPTANLKNPKTLEHEQQRVFSSLFSPALCFLDEDGEKIATQCVVISKT